MIDATGIRELGRGRWQVRVKRVDARTGRVCNRKEIVTGTRAAALRRRDAIRGELLAGTPVAREQLNLATYADQWLERRVIKASTQRKYRYELVHIRAELGALLVRAIAPSDVSGYVARRCRAGAAGNTVLNELRLLRALAHDALAEGLADRYWCHGVKPPPVHHYDDDDPNLLSREQAMRVIYHVSAQWRGLLLFVLSTGMRIGEATALRWTDLKPWVVTVADGTERGRKLHGALVRVRATNDRGAATSTKNRSSERDVFVLPEIYGLMAMPAITPDMLLFPSRRGGMHRGSPLRGVLERACAAAGVPRVTTHGLRRTFNNEARKLRAAGGVDREVLKATTGHATDDMVSHYSHVTTDEKAELARAVVAQLGVLEVSRGVADTDDN